MVSEGGAPFGEEDLRIAGGFDLAGNRPHVLRGYELPLFDIDGFPNAADRKRQIGLAAGEFNTYYCIASVARNNPLTRRRDALRAVHVIVLDDVGTGAGAKKPHGAIPLKPSAVIETSSDNFQYCYFLDEPATDLRKVQHLIREMNEGHGDAGGSMAGKLVRLPVGHNSKPSRLVSGQPFQVRLTGWSPEKRFALTDIATAFKIDITSIPEPLIVTGGARDLMGAPKHETDDVIFGWLADNGYCDTDVDYSGFVNVKCPWSDEHTDTNIGARYSPYGAGGEYRYQRQFVCFHEHCKDRKSSEFLHWVKQTGGPDLNAKTIDRFLEQYVFVGEGPRVGDLAHPRQSVSLREFHEQHKNKFYFGGSTGTKPVYYSQLWQADPDRLTVNAIGWHPGKPRIYDVNGRQFLNTYADPSTGSETTDESLLGPIFEHLRYMFPQDADYEHALDFIAWTRCKPEVRVQHALLHIAPHEGTGRGWMSQLMKALFLHRYVKSGPVLSKMSKFNDYMHESALVVFDEVHDKSTKFDVQNQLRTMITESFLEVNLKWGAKGTMEVFPNMMFFSNHYDAISISPTDRRWWVVINDAKPRSEADYDMLYDLIRDPVAVNQMYWFLRRRVVVNPNRFDIYKPPENSFAKRILRSTSDDHIQSKVRAVIDRLKLMGAKLIWDRHLRRLLRDEGLTTVDSDYESRRLRLVLKDFKVEKIYPSRVPSEAVKLMGGGPLRDDIYALPGQLDKAERNKRWANFQAMETLRMPEFKTTSPAPNVLPFKRDDD